ncbi:MAG: hypothetical protein JW856_00675 [Dehalococcoidales bacterium]|nr:hypothetical protein [Dehalococcoidales bacterium]
MSKFTERLKGVFQSPPKSMGFVTSKAELTRPRIQLVAKIGDARTKPTKKQLGAADALVLPVTAVNASEITQGVWLALGNVKEVEQVVKTNADFIIIPTNGDVLPSDNKLGKILRIEPSISDTLLRTVNELPVDAVLLSEGAEAKLAFNWQRLMLVQRFAALLNKPLLVEIAPGISGNELRLIWEAGVSGVMVTVESEPAEAVLQGLRKTIDALPFPLRRKKDSAMALIPRVAPEPEEPEEEEDE